MADLSSPLSKEGLFSTLRTDTWWLNPFLVLLGLSAFVVYATWAGMQASYYWYSAGAEGFGGYLSPMYSPPIFIDTTAPGAAPLAHSLLGSWPAWWPDIALFPASPALLILIFPALFRFTCYYYRKSYYRAFAGAPPACAVGAVPQKPYKGETGLMIFQNLHRYALYFALIFVVILSYDAVLSFFRDGQFGVGLGSVILLLNPIFIACYTFGCHSFRHLIGGNSNCMSCSKVRYTTWKKVTWLNERHQFFAWVSLIWVGLADYYVRMVSMGNFTDPNTWGV